MKKLLCTLLACVAVQAHARVDLDTLLTAARNRDQPKLNQLKEAARGDVLEVYVHYHWLSAQIRTVGGNEVQSFLSRYGNTHLADRVRSEWLNELGRRQDWAGYLAEYGKYSTPSIEQRCLYTQAALSLNQNVEAALASSRPAWFSGKAQPEACTPVFDALFAQNQLQADDAWARIRLALAANNVDLAAAIAKRTSEAEALSLHELANLQTQPEAGWPRLQQTRAEQEKALFAITRLARSAPEKAAALLQTSQANWPVDNLEQAWRTIALWAAKKHLPQASAWFELANNQAGEEEHRAWSIRAALRIGDWGKVLSRIEALPATERELSAWRYWRAYALRELGQPQAAIQAFIAVADEEDFYGLLAREELGTRLEPASVQYRPSEDEIRQIARLPEVRRAQALFEQNWRLEATREWGWALRGQNDQLLLAAAEYARQQGWYDRAIYAAERSQQLDNFALRYLAPFRDVVEKYAENEGLEPAWVYGLMRQESRFVADIKSRVGASGLMQLMPATAKWVAGKLGWKKFNPDSVTDIEVNVALGSRYLADVWKQLSSSQVLASAGYNAGPNRARAWQGETAMAAAIYIENIPFDETRIYVKRVIANATHYAQLFGKGETSIKTRIGTIAPRGGNIPDLP